MVPYSQGVEMGGGRWEIYRFWDDCWLLSGTILRDVCLIPFQDIWSTSLLVEFTVANQGWNLDVLRTLLPADVVEEIAAHPCPHDDLGPDSVVWGGTSHGEFSTKSAYDLMSSLPLVFPTRLWQAVWRWEGPQRARCLMWIILNNGLKTRSKGFRSGSWTQPFVRCAESGRTSLHILRDCTLVKEVGTFLPSDFSTLPLHG
ncbi:Reverse transcriptase zinc-binding domain [Sesbania bispinosa]|nr:Reverse transcriptase zinc-binding domain [Sesbania bispinosa]